MKAIVLWQPWASAVALGLKRNETRDWPAVCGGQRYRGWLAICAAKLNNGENFVKFYDLVSNDQPALDLFQQAYAAGQPVDFSPLYQALPFGKIVAVAWLEDCHDTNYCEINPNPEREKWGTKGWAVSQQEMSWGDYTPDRWAWRFTECWRLNTPIPVRGERKIFNVDLPENWQEQATKVF